MDRLREDDIDLVLLDIEMPSCGGIEVLRQLKADACLGNIPVIVIRRARIVASLEKRRLRKLEASPLAQILQKQKKSNDLLNVVLPASAAQESKATGYDFGRRRGGKGPASSGRGKLWPADQRGSWAPPLPIRYLGKRNQRRFANDRARIPRNRCYDP